MKLRKNALAAGAAVLAISVALPSLGVRAQAQDNLYAQNTDSSAPSKVDDAMLKRTAAAYLKVRDISVKTEQEINKTDDTAKKQQLIAESESEKVAAVKAEGMEPQQYNNVLMLVKADNGLQHKFLSYVEELRHSS